MSHENTIFELWLNAWITSLDAPTDLSTIAYVAFAKTS